MIMGEYVYRLKGKNHFTLLEINGRVEKVYHLVYWWKPGYGYGFGDPYRPKNHAALYAKLEKSFEGIDVRFVTTCDPGQIEYVYAPYVKTMSFRDGLFGTDRMPVVWQKPKQPEGDPGPK